MSHQTKMLHERVHQSPPGLDRYDPELCDLEAESDLIGMLIRSPEATRRVYAMLSPEDFGSILHRSIFRVLPELPKYRKLVNAVSDPLLVDVRVEKIHQLSGVHPDIVWKLANESCAEFGAERRVAKIKMASARRLSTYALEEAARLLRENKDIPKVRELTITAQRRLRSLEREVTR